MTNPYSRRDCNRPVLKSGLKWPCYTLHTTPLLQVRMAGAFSEEGEGNQVIDP